MPPPKITMPSGALAELLAKDGELDRILSGYGPSYEPGPPGTGITYADNGLRIEPADWDQEAREREQRERKARRAEALALLKDEPGLAEEAPAVHPPPLRESA